MVCNLAVFNMKGGVGKSTTAYNLAAGLVKFHQQKVLIVDIDPQGNASAALGISIWELEAQLKDVLQRQIAIKEIIVSTASGVDVVPSNILLAEQEIPIAGLPGRELLLRKALGSIQKAYDFIIIDCPPNVGVFAVNALMAAQKVVIPVDMSYLGLLGIQGIERALTLVRDHLDHPIAVAGALATRYDKRNNLSREVLASLQEHFGDLMFKTLIPETVKLREAPSYGQSIFDYDSNSNGAIAYQALVKEVIAR
ncbi:MULTISPECIES: ParA family protein [unclassified Synechocystis]|jgi:chromosome partitioning protein|uniref:ParA family protein n=1 Tax=unclassified Synechocystis TaxID=2640012 RepID=UPI0018F04855|nr:MULTISPECIES: ParA family protein [unclassified Synechocystis]